MQNKSKAKLCAINIFCAYFCAKLGIFKISLIDKMVCIEMNHVEIINNFFCIYCDYSVLAPDRYFFENILDK